MAFGLGCKELVGDTRIGVLLLYERRDTATLGLLQHRSACIASDTYGDIGIELPDYPARFTERLPQLPQHTEIAPQTLSVEASHRKPFNIISCCRHTLHLHAPERTHEENFGVGTPAPHGICNG